MVLGMSPVASELRRRPMSRCLDRTHKFSKGDGKTVPAGWMILGVAARIRDNVEIGVTVGVPERAELMSLQDVDDFWEDADDGLWDEEDEFG